MSGSAMSPIAITPCAASILPMCRRISRISSSCSWAHHDNSVRPCPTLSTESSRGSPMDIAVELSLYPLEPDLVPKIKDFIDRLNTASGVGVITNSLSTQVVGPFDLVFAALTREIRTTFDQVDKSVVVMKIIGPLTNSGLIQ